MKKYFLSAGIILLSIWGNAQNGKLIAEKSGKGAVVIHEVQPKEGLYTLSRVYGVKVAEIAATNGFDKDKSLLLGQKVKIPLTAENLIQKKGTTPVYYSVATGETLTGISSRFNNVPIKELKNWNKLDGNAVPKDKDIIVGYMNTVVSTTSTVPEKSTNALSKVSTAKSIGQANITGTNINIRQKPSTNEEVVGIAQQNDVVDILKKIDKEWILIRTQNGTEGYIAAQFLQPITTKKTETKKTTTVKTGKIYGVNVNIRKGPSIDQEVVAIAQQDETVEILITVNKEWVAVRTKDGVDGFVAAQFLSPREAQPEIKKVEAKAVAYSTNVNIRKGPSTDQEVVGMAKADEELIYIRKVDNDWSEIRNTEGLSGFVATRFLSFDGKPSVASIEAEKLAKATAENEKVLAATEKKEVEKAEAVVSEKIAAKNKVVSTVLDETGYFKTDFEKYKNSNLLSDHTMESGIFKTDRGWVDGKYYLLMDNAAPGTVVKLTNPGNNKSVYAKVLGKMKGIQYSDGFDVRISESAAKKLQTDNLEKFSVMVTY